MFMVKHDMLDEQHEAHEVWWWGYELWPEQRQTHSLRRTMKIQFSIFAVNILVKGQMYECEQQLLAL